MAPSLIACTPETACEPSLAIAAARAGALGLLDLGFEVPASHRAAAIAELERALAASPGSPTWGARWDAWGRADRLQASSIPPPPRGRWPWLLVAGCAHDATLLRSALDQARGIADNVLVEAEDPEAALAAEEAGCDGVVLVAHEAGGRVGDWSAFLLAQAAHARLRGPWWVRGAFGPEAAAAVRLAGAAGVALREELYLLPEAPFTDDERRAWRALDGTETVVIGDERAQVRLLRRGDRSDLAALERGIAGGDAWPGALLARWGVAGDDDRLVPCGQGIGLAARLERAHGTLGRTIAAFDRAARECLELAARQQALAPHGPLARSHGTTHPIVQGPMTRVSDVAPFAAAVAGEGALPFLALALLRGPEVERLLDETAARVGDHPWGVGVLGFVPPELRQEQVAAIRKARPPFALIAGGRPSQAAELEALGIATYLHVPSPALMSDFIARGARRFVLEGRECGGHVGPRGSLMLWQAALDVLIDATDASDAGAAQIADPAAVHVLFAGGIHDALSAAMVATLAAPLVDLGMKVGVLMGTAYLFTHEIVSTGAVGSVFQEEALACGRTVLLESSPGHATRCAPGPYADEFERAKRKLVVAGATTESMRVELEMLNIGRLRVAAKGLQRVAALADTERPATGVVARGEQLLRGELAPVPADLQRREGLFMIGQLAGLRDRILPMAELHEDASSGASRLLARAALRLRPQAPSRRPAGEPLAIIGMSCLFPGSTDLREFWRNLLAGVDAVRDVPEERWRAELFYSADRADRESTYCARGSFLDAIRFDPLRYRLPPATLPSVEPLQLLALEVAARALTDAGHDVRPLPRERTAVIVGTGAIADHGIALATRVMLRHYLDRVGALDGAGTELESRIRAILPRWTEDSFPGILPNMVAGRIANRLDLQGSNYTVDAACASSLAALHAAAQQLRAGTCDAALVGGADASNNAVGFMGFARTHALTASEHPRPFDERADGIALGEGVGAIVLKRLSDAERDGDRIRAVLRGIGSSSDGGRRSLTAPSAEGQVLAIRRALDDAGAEASTITMVEAHATGTAVGDRTELLALEQVLLEGGARAGQCAVGSAKSQFGHAKTAAGMVGLIKTVLALEHRVLPPTIHADRPLPEAAREDGPIYLCTRPRPWIASGGPRRAGVSAFGFGGTNFHAVLEEHDDGNGDRRHVDLSARPVELLAWRRASRAELARDLVALADALDVAPAPSLEQVAACVQFEERARTNPAGARLAILASTVPELVTRLRAAVEALARPEGRAPALDPLHSWLGEEEPIDPATTCFLFPGQGSQSPGMLGDLFMSPAGTRLLAEADDLLADELREPLSRVMFPLPPTGPADSADPTRARRDALALADTRFAQPALGVADLLAHDVLASFAVRPAFVAGHSYGEYVALTVAGVVSHEDLLVLSARRGRAVHEVAADHPGAMAAVAADEGAVTQALADLGIAAEIANLNAPRQTIIGGPVDEIACALRRFPERGLAIRQIPVTAAFHTHAMRDVSSRLAGLLEALPMLAPILRLTSNVTARPYPDDLPGIRALLTEHLARPVRFVEQIRAMHDDGARLFVEAGPGRVLTGLVRRILEDRPHAAMPLDDGSPSSWTSLARLLGRLHALGLPVDLQAWFEGRGLGLGPLAPALEATRARAAGGPLDWWVGPSGARPVAGPAPPRPVAQPAAQPAIAAHAAPSSSLPSAPPSQRQRPAAPPTTPIDREIPTMNDDDPRSPEQPAPVPEDAAARFQDTMREWLRHRQALDQRFLDVQERFLEVLGAGTAPAARPSAPAAMPAQPAPSRSRVAPAPVLPRLEATSPMPPVPTPSPAPTMLSVVPVAAATAPVVTAPQSATDGSFPPVEEFRRDLLAEVSQRTGYPEEMLALETPMEAGLGIDSIKVMEIFGALRRYHPVFSSVGGSEEDAVAEFAQLKTLGAILEAYDRRRAAPPSPTVAPLAVPQEAAPDIALVDAPDAQAVERRVVRAVPAPLDATDDPLRGSIPLVSPTRTLVILGKGGGIGHALEPALAGAGLRVVRVVQAASMRRVDATRYEADLSSADGARALAQELKHQGLRAGGLLNLLALDADDERADAADTAARSSLALLHACQALEEGLLSASAEGGTLVAGITRLDGQFGLGGRRPPSLAAAASLGFLKAFARELPACRLKLIDLDPDASEETLLASIVRELTSGDAETEIGFDARGRWRLDVSSEAPDAASIAGLDLDALEPGSIVLVTGGARGITTSVLALLARRARPSFVIVGRSEPGREEDEPAEARGLDDAASLRRALLLAAKSRGEDVQPAGVDATVRAILAAREVRRSVTRLRAAGAEVDYRALDVRDTRAFTSLIEELQSTGRLRGVIHAAGVIEDRRLRDKTDDSFLRVFETKVRPALTLARTLDPRQVRFVAFFSSVSARLGNARQADYAAANEVLNKLADHLARAWPCRVVAVNWGPWDGGMISGGLRDAYRQRGIGLIEPEAGARAFIDVLESGERGAAEVVVACGRPEEARVAEESVRS